MFPTIIKDLRKRKNVTQIQLAAAIGVSPGNVGDWETGKSLPGYKSLVALAQYFEVSADQLLGLELSKETALTEREVGLLKMIREMDDRDREDIFGLVEIKQRWNGR